MTVPLSPQAKTFEEEAPQTPYRLDEVPLDCGAQLSPEATEHKRWERIRVRRSATVRRARIAVFLTKSVPFAPCQTIFTITEDSLEVSSTG